MAQIVIDIPNPSVNRIVDGICLALGYEAIFVDGTANPETKNQFARRAIRDYLRQLIKIAEGEPAANTARRNVSNDVDAIGITVT